MAFGFRDHQGARRKGDFYSGFVLVFPSVETNTVESSGDLLVWQSTTHDNIIPDSAHVSILRRSVGGQGA
jgi:hypothetical protein